MTVKAVSFMKDNIPTTGVFRSTDRFFSFALKQNYAHT